VAKSANGGSTIEPEGEEVELAQAEAPATTGEAGASGQPAAQPSMRILAQYLKDLSFENPGAPQTLAPQAAAPEISIGVNVNARNLAPNDFEVELQLEAKAQAQGKTIFAAEMKYAGLFRLENFPPNMMHPAVLIECPRMLFPFARQILAEATRQGGFPPLMLDPIDFSGMYQKRMAQQSAATA
jgi:preprotein translocase subunit SecB